MTKNERKEYQRKYRENHKDQMKEYRKEHKDQKKEYMKKYRKEHKDQIKEYKRNWYYNVDLKARGGKLLNRAKIRGKGRVLITKLWIQKKLEKGFCEVTGIKFCYKKPKSHYNANPFAASLDRKDCSKGYTYKNTRVVVWSYNVAKSYLDLKDFKKLIKGIKKGVINGNY